MMSLTLTNVQAVRRRTAVSQPISLTLEGGAVLALVGPNGAGKSSLLAAIAQTSVKTRGTLTFSTGADSVALTGANAKRRAEYVSLLAQDSHGGEDMTVAQLVDVGLRANGASNASHRADRAMRETDVAHLADRRLGTLSGGQRQSAQLARVIAQDTPVVLLDEPASALDIGHRVGVERAVSALAARGRIVIAAVHDLDFAFAVATHVLVLRTDETHTLGTPTDVLTTEMLEAVYGVTTTRLTTPSGRTVLVPDSKDRTGLS